MTPTQKSIICGALCCLVVVIVKVFRQRKMLSLDDVGLVVATCFTGSNLPPAVFLFFYGIFPDALLDHTALHGYEKYISYSGIALFFISLAGWYKYIVTAWEKSTEATVSNPVSLVTAK